MSYSHNEALEAIALLQAQGFTLEDGRWTPPAAEEVEFNGLTNQEKELLTMMQEECGELIVAIAKIKRHGLYNHHPATGVINLNAMVSEVTDVFAVSHMINDHFHNHLETVPLERFSISAAKERKLRYSHHQGYVPDDNS